VGQMVNDRLQTFGRGNVEGLIVADMRIDYPALRCAANFIQALKEFFLHSRLWAANKIVGFHV
jgi:hypothetical protein